MQTDAYKHFFDLAQTRQFVFGNDLLFEIHKYFFETLYDWAGMVRTVDISKGEMLFAPVKYLINSLEELNRIIQNNTPTSSDSLTLIAERLATIHNRPAA